MLCSNADANQLVLRVTHLDASRGLLDVARCGACASLWYVDLAAFRIEYPAAPELEDHPHFRLLGRHYIELVGGLDWRVGLLERTPFETANSVLEIGCSVGLVLDYIRTVWGASVVGLEPSVYGQLGRDLLDLPILRDYMADATEIRGRQFDVVVATEVVEHTDDPAQFLAELASFVAPDGYAVITTPRANSIDDSHLSHGEITAALSPGGHVFLESAQQLDRMLRDAGFGWVHIEPFGMTHFAVAAHQPLDIRPMFDTTARRAEYYRGRVERGLGDARQRLSDQLALFNADRALGRPSEPALLASIERDLRAEFGLELLDPVTLVASLTSTTTLFELAEMGPFALAEAVYWTGHEDHVEWADRADRFAAAGLLANHAMRVDPVLNFVCDRVARLAVTALAGLPATDLTDRLGAELPTNPTLADLVVATRASAQASLLSRARRLVGRRG